MSDVRLSDFFFNPTPMPINTSIKRLEFCTFKLNTLLSLTQAINDNLSTQNLIDKYERLLRDDLRIGKVLVYSYNTNWSVILKSGFERYPREEAIPIDVETDLLQHKEITTTIQASNVLVRYFDIIIPVFHNNSAIAYVLIGDIDEEQDGISPTIKHLSFIQTLTNIIMVAIENRRLQIDHLKQEAMRKELELASKMQSMLIPNLYALPNNKYYYVDAYYFPHSEVGGDYYDFIQLNNEEVGFCIADVSGKGISAALLMSNFQANLRALFTLDISLTELVRKLNQQIIATANADKFITLFIGKYNHSTKRLRYVNAGHNPPILYYKKTNQTVYLNKGCMGIGMIDEIPAVDEGELLFEHLTESENPLESSVKLLCYTDGLVELKTASMVDYGIETIEKIFANKKRIDKTINDLILKLQIKKGNDSIFDDISILGIEFF